MCEVKMPVLLKKHTHKKTKQDLTQWGKALKMEHSGSY